MAEEKLTPKQERFVQEYLIDLNATQAAIRAGYSQKTADVQGPRLLGNVRVARAINAAQAETAKRLNLSQDWVLQRLKDISDRCTQAEPVFDRQGEPTGEYRFDSAGANRATELIGKHLGMFTDKIEHSGAIISIEQVLYEIDKLESEPESEPETEPEELDGQEE